MSQISSINFKKSMAVQTQHNDRLLPPNYLIGGDFEVNRKSKEALVLKNQIITKAVQDYENTYNQKFQAKSYEWSAVVNIKDTTTMKDLENLSAHIQEKYGYQCYQIAIHRDEGHINDDGEKVINHHAHFEFISLDRNTGRSLSRDLFNDRPKMRQIQTEVAEILGMERGQDKRISKRERIEPRKYAQMKEQERTNTKELKREQKTIKKENEALKKDFLTQKEINARIEQERKAWILEKDHTAQEYKELRELKKQNKITIQELEKQIQELNEQLKKQKEDETLRLNALEAKIKAEKEKNKELQAQKDKIDLNANLSVLEPNSSNEPKKELESIQEMPKNDVIEALKQENEQLKDYFKKTIAIVEPHIKKQIQEKQTQIFNYQNQGIGENMIIHKTAKDSLSFFEKIKELYTKIAKNFSLKLPSEKERERIQQTKEQSKNKNQGRDR